jgi:hypothetical protein
MRNLEKKFIKSYEAPAERKFRHTAMVRHNDEVIAFAMDDQQQIHYTTLNPDRHGEADGLQVSAWDATPRELKFPEEICQVSNEETSLHKLPEVKTGGKKDWLLSTTARLTAEAPFQALSDGRYVYLFRQSLAGDHSHNVKAPASSLPIVENTLLLDRFVYVEGMLKPKPERRYQRSRKKNLPAGSKDTLGFVDLEKNPFYEPTLELDFIRHLTAGRFSVLLIPTGLPDVERWQIFAYNRTTDRIDSFNAGRDANGLFDIQGNEHTYFSLADRTVASGLTAAYYYQQKNAVTGYGTEAKPIKRQARVMLAAPAASSAPADRNHIAVLDFAVSVDGKLAQVPEIISLPSLHKPAPAATPIIASFHQRSADEQKNDVAKLNGEIQIPMPLIHTDPNGLSVTGGLLDFAWTDDAPYLCESANGRLNLYFRGERNEFFAAYYDVRAGHWFADSQGAALIFDLHEDHLVPTTGLENFAVEGDLTLEMWVNPSALPDGLFRLIHSHQSPDSRYTLGLAHNHAFAGVGEQIQQTEIQLPLGVWSHLAAVYQQATSALTLFLNGDAAATRAWNEELDGPRPEWGNAQFSIGAGKPNGEIRTKFQGMLDEVRL